MFKKMRLRFILMTMLSVLAVLLVIMGSINYLNYRSVVRESDRILDLLAENDGQFPDLQSGGRADAGVLPEFDGASRAARPDDAPDDRPELPPDNRRDDRMTAETPFESRFFSVLLAADGSVSATDVDHIAAVDAEAAGDYATKALAKSNARGFLASYRYLRTETEYGVRVIFLDCTRSIASFRSFLTTSVLVSLVGLAAVMLLVIFFSRRIVRPMQESYEKQKRFITDASHELKTPLTVIDADLSVLATEVGEREWISDARAQTKRLAKLTNDLVYLSRMDEAQRQVEMIEFSLSDLVAEEAQSFAARAMVEDKRFTSEVAPMLGLVGNEAAVRELLSILLDNAIKYSDAGGWIRLALTPRTKGVQLVVSNSCAAIDVAALPQLFDRFYRTDSSRNSSAGGYGLGLSIARAIVQAHRGKISAASADGRSLSITVQL